MIHGFGILIHPGAKEIIEFFGVFLIAGFLIGGNQRHEPAVPVEGMHPFEVADGVDAPVEFSGQLLVENVQLLPSKEPSPEVIVQPIRLLSASVAETGNVKVVSLQVKKLWSGGMLHTGTEFLVTVILTVPPQVSPQESSHSNVAE